MVLTISLTGPYLYPRKDFPSHLRSFHVRTNNSALRLGYPVGLGLGRRTHQGLHQSHRHSNCIDIRLNNDLSGHLRPALCQSICLIERTGSLDSVLCRCQLIGNGHNDQQHTLLRRTDKYIPSIDGDGAAAAANDR